MRAAIRSRSRKRPAPRKRVRGKAFSGRRPNYELRRAVLVLVLLLTGLAIYAALRPEENTEAPPTDVPEREQPVSTDEAWEYIADRDPSPSLAVFGEPYDYERQIALTFDDGPDPDATPAVLEVLQEHELKATFFVVGRKVEENPELVRRIVREGHTLANHTYSHPNMAGLDEREIQAELRGTQEAVDRALGYPYPMTLMRPPYGAPYLSDQHTLPLFMRIVWKQRAYPVMWTVDPRDWQLEGQASAIVENVRASTAKEGGVVLLHDTHLSTAEALPQIIAQSEAAGLAFTTVREMLADKYGVEPESIQAAP